MEKEEKATLNQEQKKDNDKDVIITPKPENSLLQNNDNLLASSNEDKKRKKKKKKSKKNKKKLQEEEEKEKAAKKKTTKKSVFSNEQFIINGNYNLIKMLGFGAFGEIHLAYDTAQKQLRAIKFEIASHKNPQLKHEYSILEQLNKIDNSNTNKNYINSSQENIGIPKVYGFDRMENKYNYMIMDFLGPSVSDLYQLCEKNFSLETILMIGIQMLTRIEFIHEKGYIHRDIKPENFVIGVNEKTNIIHIIDFGLSKRYKDKSSGQHIPYRENRHLVGTVRYASINAHLGVEQSRRDDIESIGYVLVYFFYGRLPWQSNGDKGKPQTQKIMEKKLITPPEILCKKMPSQFAYFFHYCKNLKFEDRPDYATLKTLFAEILYSRVKIGSVFTFDWFNDGRKNNRDDLNSSKLNMDNNGALNSSNGNNTSLLKNQGGTPNPDIMEQYNPTLFLDKYNINNNPNGITETLKIEKILKDTGNPKDNPLGIIQNKTSDSKSSYSDSYSDGSDHKENSSSEKISESGKQNTDSSLEKAKQKEKGSSDSNYGILKSDSDQI